jgi:hypothetical protein
MLRVIFALFKSVLFVLILASAISPVCAADWYPATPSPKVIDDWIVSVDASTTGSSSQSYFTEAAVTAAIPGSLSTSGARLRFEGLAGTYEYLSETNMQVRGQQVAAAALGGYEWVGPRSKFAIYLGGMALNTALSRPDPNNSANGLSLGLKGAIDFYTQPSERTMVSAYGAFATNDSQFFTRLRVGYMLPGGFYIGPESAFMGNNTYALWQVGAFLTGMQFGPVQGGLSIGYQQDRDRKSGVYGAADLRVLF